VNLVDTSAWIEYFFGGPNAEYFAAPIEATGTLLVSTISIYEVFKKVNIVANEARALNAIAQMKQGRVEPVTESIALSAALLSIKHKLAMADSLILATAQQCRATLWTQDKDFNGLPDMNFKTAHSNLSAFHGKPRR